MNRNNSMNNNQPLFGDGKNGQYTYLTYEDYLKGITKEQLSKIINDINERSHSSGITPFEFRVRDDANNLLRTKSGSRRSTKSSKKHPTARRHRRSSNARKSRATRRR